jgi:hypothetical protein
LEICSDRTRWLLTLPKPSSQCTLPEDKSYESANCFYNKKIKKADDRNQIFKGTMAMRRIFWGFCRNWFLIDRLHYLSSHSDFGFKFAGFVIEKRLPDRESATLRLGESGSRRPTDMATMGAIGKGQDRSKVMYSSGRPISLDPCMSFSYGSICSCWGRDVRGPKE